MLKTLKTNLVSSVLLLTMLLGVLMTFIEWPEGRLHGMKYNWVAKFVFDYVIGFSLLGLIIHFSRGIDRVIASIYLFWDVVGFVLYLYQGWPEPKLLIIGGFGITVIIYLIVDLWKFYVK